MSKRINKRSTAQKSQSDILKRIIQFVIDHRIQILIFVGALIVFYFRRTDAITNPQLWAEDGNQWLQPVINNHFALTSFFATYAGYLALFARIVAFASGAVSLEYVPLFFNTCALIVQALPLVYLWSKRTDYISTRMKIFISIAYVLMPFTAEVHANITNSQWFLALTLFLLLFIKDSKNKVVRWIEYSLVAITSLSGPFSIVLSPIVAYEAYRTKKINKKYIIVIIGAIIQILFVLFSNSRVKQSIGISATELFNIIGGQVFGAGLFGYKSIDFFFSKPWIAPVTAIIGIELMVYVFIKSGRVLKYYILFATAIFAAALLSPNGNLPGNTWWQTLTTLQAGGRYYFLIHLAVFICLGWLLLAQKNLFLKVAAGLILVPAIILGVPRDFKHDAYQNLHYRNYINKYESSPKGTVIVVPINPGPPWEITLEK